VTRSWAGAAWVVGVVLLACDGAPAGSAGAGGQGAAAAPGTSAGSGGTTTATTTSSTSSSAAGAAGGAPDLCAACEPAETAGNIAFAAIDEVSGVAASRLHDDVFYVHDDSGESARFFAIARDGAGRGTFTVTGAAAVDWEDMAPSPCADGSSGCLILADVGDNAEERADVALYRVAEPTEVGSGVTATLAAEPLPFSYPDGPHDVEAVAVHPTTGVVTLLTKAATTAIFELRPPLRAGMVAVRVGERSLPSFVPLATGADIDEAGTRLAVRTYADVLLFPIAAGETAAAALQEPGCKAPIAAEMQGEAVAWLTRGVGFVTIPEGEAAAVHITSCGPGE